MRTLGRREMDHVAIRLEHVDLLDCLDRLHIELLERLLELLVVGRRPRRGPLDFPTRSALATVRSLSLASHALRRRCSVGEVEVCNIPYSDKSAINLSPKKGTKGFGVNLPILAPAPSFLRRS